MSADYNAGMPAQPAQEMVSIAGQSFEIPAGFDFDAAAQEFGTLPDFSMGDDSAAIYGYISNTYINNDNSIADNSIADNSIADNSIADNSIADNTITDSNHFSGGFEETTSAKTPGYEHDVEDPNYISPDAPCQSSNLNDGYQSYAPKTPFNTVVNTYEAKTPYVAPTPFTTPYHSNDFSGGIPELGLNGIGTKPSEPFFPGPSPMEASFGASRPASPVTKPDYGKKAPKKTPVRKAKTKAKVAIGGDNDDDEVRKPISSTRGKGKKSKEVVEEEEEYEEDTPVPAKAKGRKGAAVKNTATTARKPRATAASKKAAPKTGRTRAPAKNIMAVKPIPRNFEECDQADQELITMREAGHDWAECKARYDELTGGDYGKSTVPNRYERLKTAFINMRDEDNLLLFDAKAKLDADYESKKWDLIAAEVHDQGGIFYDPNDLRRRFRALMERSGVPVDVGHARNDLDFHKPGDFEGTEEPEDAREFERERGAAPNITWDDFEEDDAGAGAEDEASFNAFQGQESRDYTRMDIDDEDNDEEALAY
ncbi:hypothetical protein AUEXF2481DRAFT_2229 [Aureobasidium subglaciale EXF-2481]|uniref:Uncharacterized protein n=1 Tax=Aureobasidium subglaciale (strain EXF-2481) TaxID=1043005 RepID=A0A074YKC4_AURSE|nr:uncharacterized protein AUEXF2481DRAFT_2229 [Aureobasidium subglaciale EXF-2481]KAI5219609.1 hypothetical protein E4T41_07852 [Aureobasidium subglaciale]KEQ98268.1 hypothetical protein AUEXF2481DRAFT_2229 [Aureobasidium subglaciale EXF-2481]